jgi:hypothetical protein
MFEIFEMFEMFRKRAQIRMGETIAVLIIFFFLLILGVTFYVSVQRNRIESHTFEILQQESIMVSQVVSFLPELQCSSDNIVTDNCYDLYKLGAAENHILSNTDFYYPFFKYSNIVIYELYPYERNWTLYDNKHPDSAPYRTWLPISLYNATTKRFSFGVLSIGYYPTYIQ